MKCAATKRDPSLVAADFICGERSHVSNSCIQQALRGILGCVLQDGFFDPRKPWFIRWGKSLPHWRQDAATYFITFRLADSLPQPKLDLLRRERDAWLETHLALQDNELVEFELQQRRKVERWLDEGYGSCILRPEAAKQIVTSALRFFDGRWYELGEHAVAANHVHAVVRMAAGIDPTQAIGSWKRHSSLEIGRSPDLRRPRSAAGLWQTEAFDHIVRDQTSLERFSAYIRRHRER